ncbi:DUF3180 domain-containing protein [Nocardioides sp.]|uniref:DUF3180 domain-containing protein n=1 Tax=Nocardioides sp. TaxID=35761 RepID=UPI003565DB23
MTRDAQEPGPDDADPAGPDPEGYTGRLRPITPLALTAWGVAGLVAGWSLHLVAEEVSGSVPVVSWVQPLAMLLLAVVVGTAAWQTWRAVHGRGERLEPHRAVNLLVLGRAAGMVGALMAGGYAGFAVSWIGSPAELAEQRIIRSVIAAAAGIGIMVGGVLLERSCRVKTPPKPPQTRP